MPLRFLRFRLRRQPSIREWLLGASLLTVLGGYGALFAAQSLLATQERRGAHLQTLTSVADQLGALQTAAGGSASAAPALLVAPTLLVRLERPDGLPLVLSRLSPEFPLPQGRTAWGLMAELAGRGGPGEQGHLVNLGGENYLFSGVPLWFAGGPARLQVLEAVGSRERSERTNALLLLAAAGSATLLTGLVLRPVLDRGLAPLHQLGIRLKRIEFDSLPSERLPLQRQPQELRPIIRAFNDLLHRLAASWSRQNAFVDGVAHELRTPITLINGYAQSLQRHGAVSGAALRQLALIQSESERMARMVTDLLDLARDDADRLALRREQLDPELLLLETYERLAQFAEGRLRLVASGQGEEELDVWGDPHRMQQCLTNLVENALKYAPSSSPIMLEATVSPEAVCLHVRDQGPGVPEQERQRIFERFVRGSTAEGCSGSGLGLSVVRLLMERMGGSVAVAEAPEGGADFQLVLPVRSGSSPPSA